MRWLATLTLALVLAACDSPSSTEPGRITVMGTIDFFDEPVEVSVPDTVEVEEDFTVNVRTYGDGCVEKGPTNVQVNELSASVTPFDFQVQAEVCPAVLRRHEHSATVRFEESGTAAVSFRGRKIPEGGIMTVTRTVVVR